MDSGGGFHEEEKDGKQFLVYHHPKYRPITNEAASHDHPLQPLFLCPDSRYEEDVPESSRICPLNSSPEYVPSSTRPTHPVLPLFWCNNKEFDVDGGCDICRGSNFGTDYYFCSDCHGEKYHKECVESPTKITHPYHPEHPLQLYFSYDSFTTECYCCGRSARYMVYHCTICEIIMHPICAMKPIPFVIDQPKTHHHPLTFFPRQTSLTCNVCGLLETKYPTYVCLECNFVAHSDCTYFPHIIKISRHHHRVSYISSLQSGEWSCGVCRQSIDVLYGGYACEKCNDYVVHSRCALGKDVWDGEELEGVPAKDDLAQHDGPFNMISEGVILHFLHDHHNLLLKASILYDEKEFCQACVLPIYEGNFYSCMECDYILHETCAKTPRSIQHGLHPHPLTLKAVSGYGNGIYKCNACDRRCGGFVYECHIGECTFDLDVRCSLVSEPFGYEGHEHPLFLTLDPIEKPICHVCKIKCHKQLNCINCNFIVCIKCATLPYKVRHTHDKHFLSFLYGKEKCEKDWCEVCEDCLGDTNTEVFYWCNECSNTFHIECLFGKDPYVKPGQFYTVRGKVVQILGKTNLSRPVCGNCEKRCQGKIFKTDKGIACSTHCGYWIF